MRICPVFKILFHMGQAAKTLQMETPYKCLCSSLAYIRTITEPHKDS